MSEEDAVALFAEDAPRGSEGGLTFYAKCTQVFTPNSCSVVWGSVSFVGDLRDEDVKAIQQWIVGFKEKLKAKQSLIRGAAISIDVEYGPCTAVIWNPRFDEFTSVDLPIR